MTLSDDEVPDDRRQLHDDDGEQGRRHGYRRNEDVMRAQALRSKRWARAFIGLAVAIVLAGIISMIVIANHTSTTTSKETTAERQDRVQNVSELCDGINANEAYIQTVVGSVDAHAGKLILPKPPPKLNCATLLVREASETGK